MPGMRLTFRAAAILVPVMLFLAACGGGGEDAPTGGGTDEEYLRAICQGTSDFSNALLSKTTAGEIADVIREFTEHMKDANPPGDLVKYNDEFVQYLEDSLKDPTSLVTREPPLPSEDIQRRLAGKELSVDECKNGTFFSRGLAPAP